VWKGTTRVDPTLGPRLTRHKYPTALSHAWHQAAAQHRSASHSRPTSTSSRIALVTYEALGPQRINADASLSLRRTYGLSG
jgi:hypothetical protein